MALVERVVAGIGNVLVDGERMVLDERHDQIEAGVLIPVSPAREKIGVASKRDQENQQVMTARVQRVEHHGAGALRSADSTMLYERMCCRASVRPVRSRRRLRAAHRPNFNAEIAHNAVRKTSATAAPRCLRM